MPELSRTAKLREESARYQVEDSMKQHILAAAIVTFSTTPMFAQAIPGDVLNCKNLRVDADRLACYDRAMAEDRTVKIETPAPVAEPAPEKPKSKWLARRDSSAITDDTNHFLSVQSVGAHQCRQYGNPSSITLMARCLEDTTALLIYGDCHVASGFGGYGEVTWRTDDDKAQSRSFEASTDSQALGLWSGGRSIPAIKELFGKERLVVRFTPFGMSPIEIPFDITGLEEAIAPLREECGW